MKSKHKQAKQRQRKQRVQKHRNINRNQKTVKTPTEVTVASPRDVGSSLRLIAIGLIMVMLGIIAYVAL